MQILKHIWTHLWLAFAFAVVFGGLNAFLLWMFISFGYAALTITYVLIIIGLVQFYKLTTVTKGWWTVLSFVLNFILWTAEQVNFEQAFHNTALYQDDIVSPIFIVSFAAILFAINKAVIDGVFMVFGIPTEKEMRIVKLLKNKRLPPTTAKPNA